MAAQFVTDSLAWLGLSKAVEDRANKMTRIHSQPNFTTDGGSSTTSGGLRQTHDGVSQGSMHSMKTSKSALNLSTSCPLLTVRREQPVVCDDNATTATPPENINIFKEYAVSKHKV